MSGFKINVENDSSLNIIYICVSSQVCLYISFSTALCLLVCEVQSSSGAVCIS